LALSSSAQDAKKEDKPAAARPAIEVAGYTRPGNPDDKFTADNQLIRRVTFEGEVKTFKIMGGTVYFAVFKNTGLIDGDTFSTGLANFDAKFEAGRSFRDSMSPRFDRKAKYLYLYQVVNDRNIDPRITETKGPAGGGIVNPFLVPGKLDANMKAPATEDIASFALKLITDPRYITSWGHFRDSGFIANVADVDGTGKVVKNVVDDGKGNKVDGPTKIMPIAFSHVPAIVTKLTRPEYLRRARAHSLGELEAGFGVDKSDLNLKQSKAHADMQALHGKLDKEHTLVNYVGNLIKASDAGKEPDFVQLLYLSAEERAALVPAGMLDAFEDEVTRAIFRVDWRNANLLKQGNRSVVFGFTSDLPPVSAPIRIDTPRASVIGEGLRLANYFSDEGIARAPGGEGIVNVAGAAAAALALAMGTALGNAVTPAAPPAEVGLGGIAGGFSGLGGVTGGGGGGGFVPGFGGGGGFGTGTGNGNTTGTQSQTGTQSGAQNITITNTVTTNFDATLTNQQNQNQNQSQFQIQNQNQNQNQHQNNRNNNGRHGHHGHRGNNCSGNNGHVVPAPASLLLGLLGLPGLLLLRRRNNNADAGEETPVA